MSSSIETEKVAAFDQNLSLSQILEILKASTRDKIEKLEKYTSGKEKPLKVAKVVEQIIGLLPSQEEKNFPNYSEFLEWVNQILEENRFGIEIDGHSIMVRVFQNGDKIEVNGRKREIEKIHPVGVLPSIQVIKKLGYFSGINQWDCGFIANGKNIIKIPLPGNYFLSPLDDTSNDTI